MKIIIPLALLIGGACLCFAGLTRLKDARASAGWPTAQGQITGSSITETRRRKAPKHVVMESKYTPTIQYQFAVDGVNYAGNQLRFGQSPSNSKQSPLEDVTRYPVGKPVEVYYKPSDPEVSVIEPGMRTEAWFYPAGGILMFIAGLFVLKRFRRRKA